ncbi:MAG TPA: hypothetical protein VNJ49_22185 [Bradyrhizobium sp.]|nr:hypothetical protein [Bradyrhizobium sp.]
MQPDGIGQRQHRQRPEHHLVRHRNDRADRARLIRWLAVVVAGRLLLRVARYIKDLAIVVSEIDLALNRRSRGRRGIAVEMAERQQELQRQREQRQPRTRLDVSPEPLHGITDVIL